MKKFFSVTLAIVMLLSTLTMFGCGKATGLDAIKKAGKLTMYTEAGFAPYEFVYNNEIVGVDIEIMKAVADRIGVELEVQDTNFDAIIGGVQTGKVNAGAAGITITAERLESVDFSTPYTQTEQYVILPAGNTTIKFAEDLAGKNVGVQNGTTSDLLVEEMISNGKMAGATLTPYNTPAMAAAAIGKIDAVVTDKLTAEIIINNNEGLQAFPLVNSDGTPVAEIEKYGICIAKGNEDLLAIINEVLDELIAAGKIAQWEQEYSAKATEVGA
ncbi:MAG: transporter substrate-binding domain-containing protein [Clostridia bacterium]|jgi:polar amino acid transport system substrate-binding protein|nr:transporter substrate-binding domain-containing protein [Clostridia bacterium]